MKTYIESIFGPVQIVMLPDVEEEFGFLTGRMTERAYEECAAKFPNIIRMIRDKKVIVLMNKSDLKPVVSCSDIEQHLQAPIIEISAREETGLDAFENTLKDMFFAGDIHYNDELCITNVRHKAAIAAALESLKMVMNSINDGMPEDFFSIDLMDAYEQLGHIIGEAVEDDLVDTIFSDFCMGK